MKNRVRAAIRGLLQGQDIKVLAKEQFCQQFEVRHGKAGL